MQQASVIGKEQANITTLHYYNNISAHASTCSILKIKCIYNVTPLIMNMQMNSFQKMGIPSLIYFSCAVEMIRRYTCSEHPESPGLVQPVGGVVLVAHKQTWQSDVAEAAKLTYISMLAFQIMRRYADANSSSKATSS